MRQYRFVQFDVFTDVPFGGNQLAAIMDASGLTDEEMRKIAQEMNHSETTFVFPATDVKATRKVRIFTTSTELPFAGHPTIGTTFALAHDKVVRSGDALPIYLQLASGTFPLDLFFEGDELSFVWMHQPVPEFVAWSGDAPRLMAAVGLSMEDLAAELPIEQGGSSGVTFIYLPLRGLEALRRATPGNPDLVSAVGGPGATTGVYLFSVNPVKGAYLAGADPVIGPEPPTRRSRMFAPTPGNNEDAATGAAAGPFAAYLLRHSRIRADRDGDARLHVVQGVEMGRPSLIKVGLTCESGTVGEIGKVVDVRIGGEAIFVAEGNIILP
ncbi:MAG: PhzF family phenazine biosynthesis protein [Ktedonobacterales bacterium]